MNTRTELWVLTAVGVASLTLSLIGGPWWWTLVPGLLGTIVIPAMLVRLLGGPRWPVGVVGVGLGLIVAMAMLVPVGVVMHFLPWVRLDRAGWFVGLTVETLGLWAVGLWRVPRPEVAPRGVQIPWWRGLVPTTVGSLAATVALLGSLAATGSWVTSNQEHVMVSGQATELWLDREGDLVTVSVRRAPSDTSKYRLRVKESGNDDLYIDVDVPGGEVFTHALTITDEEQKLSGRWAVLEVDLFEVGRNLPVRSVYLDELVDPKQ